MTVSQRVRIEQTKRTASRASELAYLIEMDDFIHIRFGTAENEETIGIMDRITITDALKKYSAEMYKEAYQMEHDYR